MELAYARQRGDKLFNGTGEVPNPTGINTTFHLQSARIAYRPLSELALNVVAPRVDITRRQAGTPEISIRGLGDISLYGEWSPWRSPPKGDGEGPPRKPNKYLAGLTFIAGIEAPTGEDSSIPFIAATTPSLLQAGSGTWDPIVGVNYDLWLDRLALFHQTAAILPVGESGAGLNPGDSVVNVTGVGYEIFDGVMARVSADTILRGRESLNGGLIGNTGAALGFITPGLSVKLRKDVSADLTARVPFYRSVVGTQLTPGIRYRLELVWRF